MDVSQILEKVGEWGRYQKVIYFMACLPSVISAMINVGYSWIVFDMNHRCLVPSCENSSNAEYSADFLNWSTPAGDGYPWSRCTQYPFRRNTSAADSENNCRPENFLQSETQSCSDWVYDTSIMENTLISEFGLVCDDAWLGAFGSSMFFVGLAFGSIASGYVADRFGRLTALLAGLVLTIPIATASAFASSIAIFITLRALTALTMFGLFTNAFVLSMELTSVKERCFCGVVINIFFAIGEALSGVFPIFVKDWRILQLIYALPLIPFLSYWFLLPESPRWLVSVGKHEKAEKVLRNVAKWNGKDFPEDLVKQKNRSETSENLVQPSESFLLIFKPSTLLARTSVVLFQWLVTSMVYYGIGMISTDLAGNVYLNFVLTMLIEIPSYVFALITINPLGRKLVVSVSFFLCGLGTLLAGILQGIGPAWLSTVLALIGKFGVASAFALLYVYAAELYPTSLRSQAIGLASAFGRIGSIVAPFIADANNGDPTVPLCVFGVFGLLAAAATLFLPETSGRLMPDTIQQAVNLGKDEPLLPIPCLLARRRSPASAIYGTTEENSDQQL